MEFGFQTEVKVRFAETDAQGIAHHAEGIEALTLEAQVTYRIPARFDDRLVINARCRDVSGARFTFEYRVERDGQLLADGSTRHACADAATLRPTRVPRWLVEAIAAVEA